MRRLFDSLRCCLNPKVIGGLAVAGLVIWLVAPTGGAATLPLLIALVCPLSMGAMAWRMRRTGSCAAGSPLAAATERQDVDTQLGALREEIAIARARRQLTVGNDQHPS